MRPPTTLFGVAFRREDTVFRYVEMMEPLGHLFDFVFLQAWIRGHHPTGEGRSFLTGNEPFLGGLHDCDALTCITAFRNGSVVVRWGQGVEQSGFVATAAQSLIGVP